MIVELLIVAGIAWVGIALLLGVTFLVARRLDNYGIVDAVWALLFTPVVLWYALAFEERGVREVILVLMTALWSLRLGVHLAFRIAAAHPEEDWRYRQLRDEWGERFNGRMFGFYQVQGILALVLTTPWLLAAADPRGGLGWWELAGVVLFGLAIGGEALADWQLRRFKRGGPSRGEVCRLGLWRFSRHPNYFFEWLIWVGFAVYALGSPFGWLGLISPALMLWLLLKVTGIPPTEEQAVKSKGEGYRAYQRTTPAFFPWFPREDPGPPRGE